MVELTPYDSSIASTRNLYYSNADFGVAEGAPAEFVLAVAAPYQLDASLYLSDGEAAITGNSTPSLGAIELANATGDLDDLLGYDWDSREVIVRVGFEGYTYSQFAKVIVGTASSVRLNQSGGGLDSIFIDLKDNRFKLRGDIQTTLFKGNVTATGTDISFTATDTISSTDTDLSVFTAGMLVQVVGSASNDAFLTVGSSTTTSITISGGTVSTEAAGASVTIRSVLEGGDELKGKPKPLAYGQERQVEPPPVSTTLLIYQLNDAAIESIQAVRDRGVDLSFDADYASGRLLAGATVAGGDYATCLAEGLFRLGSSPSGVVTCDYEGDASGSGYVSDVSGIVQRIVVDRGGLTTADLDLGSFSDFAATQSAVVGAYFGTEQRSIANALDDLLTSAGGFWGSTRTGLIRIKRINNPGGETAISILGDGGKVIKSPQDGGDWEIRSVALPSHTVRVGYKRYYKFISGQEVAGSVTDAVRADYGEEYRYETAEDSAAVLARNPAAKVLVFNSSFDTSAAAEAEADRLLPLYKVPRQTLTCVVYGALLEYELGDVVQVVNTRYGLSLGKNFLIVGFSEDASWSSGEPGLVTLTLWG